MRSVRHYAVCAVATVALGAAAGLGVLEAQAPQQPATVTIRGHVIAADTGTSVPYARIQLRDTSSFTRADVDGGFSLVVPLTGAVAVTKAGFLKTERTLPVPAGDLEIRLTRAAALSGRVVNEFGEPIVDAVVSATFSNLDQSAAVSATTNDRGEYRIGGLAPGSYRVAVQTIGAELVATPVEAASIGNKQPPVAGYRRAASTTYFPDTVDAARAADIPLSAAAQRDDIDFHLPAARTQWQPSLMTMPLPLVQVVDPRPPDPEGAIIRGTIVDQQGRPLPYAQVTVDGTAFTTPDVNGPAGMVLRSSPADERGGYEFIGLRAGFYTVRAAKAGYATPPFDPLRPPASATRAIRAGEVSVQNVTLVQWGAISGRLRDEFGDPVKGATITLLQSRYERGARRLVEAPVSRRTTDDRGEFRVFSVPPGDYIVAASIRDAAAADLAGYTQTFYPGTASGGEAQRVAVDLGSDVGGLEFALFTTSTARVTGTTVDASGNPTTQLRLALVSRSSIGAPLDAQINVDGTFAFENVPPGQYVLKADSGRTNTFTEGEFAALPVTVGQADITDLRVQASAGSTITGRFVFDRFVTTTDPPPTAVTITAIPDDFDLAPSSIAAAQANAVGVFQLRGVTGPRRLQVTRVPPKYMVRSILVNGRDVTDEPVQFGRASQSVEDVEVVLTDRINQLTGSVTDGRVKAGAGSHVVVFSTDRERWYPVSRHLRHQLTSADGGFTVTGLPAGSYFAVALPSVPAGDDAWQDPAFLESVLDEALVLSIGEGQAEDIDLRLSRR